jgi:hypothetical protein
MGRTGVHVLLEGVVEGHGPLAPFGLRAAADLARVAVMAECRHGPLVGLYDVDPGAPQPPQRRPRGSVRPHLVAVLMSCASPSPRCSWAATPGASPSGSGGWPWGRYNWSALWSGRTLLLRYA